jgi:hypothetical protein
LETNCQHVGFESVKTPYDCGDAETAGNDIRSARGVALENCFRSDAERARSLSELRCTDAMSRIYSLAGKNCCKLVLVASSIDGALARGVMVMFSREFVFREVQCPSVLERGTTTKICSEHNSPRAPGCVGRTHTRNFGHLNSHIFSLGLLRHGDGSFGRWTTDMATQSAGRLPESVCKSHQV